MMKFVIFFIVLFDVTSNGFAQFDNRFYFPSKDYQLDDKLIYEDLFFETDTVKLHVLHLKPNASVKATILFYIGGGGNASSYSYIAKPLLAAGYQVFIPEPRGYGKSTGVPTHINIAADAQYIFDTIVNRNCVKNTAILIYGASMGSQIAVKMAKDNQGKVNGLILDCPISSFTDIALASSPEEQRHFISQYVTSPYSAKEDIKDIYNMAKLIIYSAEDKSGLPEQGALVFSNAKQPKRLWVYNGEHLMSSVEYQDTFVKNIDSTLNAGQDSWNNAAQYKIDILIIGLKNNNGQVVIELMDTLEQTITSVTEKIINNQCHVILTQIESGCYTITYYHDENRNNKFDTNFIGMPKEGYGFSNNASGKYGPPPIEDRTFVVSKNLSMILKPYYK
jgi:uncharacterized protein